MRDILEEFIYGTRKRDFICSVLLTFIWSLMNAGFAHIMAVLFASAYDMQKLKFYAIVFAGYIILWEISEFLGDIVNGKLEVNIENATHDYYLNKLYKTSPRRIKDTNGGYLSGLIATHISNKKEVIHSVLSMSIISIVSIVYSICVFASMSPLLGLSTVVVFGVGMAVRIGSIKCVQKYKKDYFNERAGLKKTFMDSVNNISTVQKLRAIDFINEKFEENKDNIHKYFTKMIYVEEIFFCLYKTAMYLLLPVNLLISVYVASKDPTFNLTEAISYISLNAVTMVHNTKYIAGALRDINSYFVSKKQLDEIINDQDQDYTKSTIGNDFDEIELKNVRYQYPNTETVISIPSLKIRKGDIVAISGESGQGKSTLLNILSGELDNGHIYVDGKPCKKGIGPVYVAQDVEMFDMTLRENLLLGNKISDLELVKMLYAVGMGEWLEKQKEGLSVIIGERGVKVSTGQRQRFNLIRGLLYDKEIYFLDEPTSNVDEITEEKIIRLIQERLKGKTVVIVTHRPKIKEICTREYVFEDNVLQEG